jgi:hypothetical protein
MMNRAKIRDHNNYWVNYAAFEGGLHQGSTQYSFGTVKKRKTPTTTKDLGGANFQGPKLDANKLLASWWLDAPKLLMNPWVENRPVFADLLTAFKTQGFKVITEERVMDFHGKQLKNYRIVADRAAAAAKASGPAHTEIVFDAARGLPVSIFVTAAPPKQAPIALNLRADWRFNMKFSDKALQTFGDVS